MFERLFARNGLSLDRIRALLEVGANGSIAKAAGGDPIRQSQYSRQIKELEDFFQSRLIERQGKGIRLTDNGRELARIARFFLLGLSNFQRGCLTEELTFKIGAPAGFIQACLLSALARSEVVKASVHYAVEVAGADEIERRLHDLTLDFAVTTCANLSRPLQVREMGKWHLDLWVPKRLHPNEKLARQAFAQKRLPLALAGAEIEEPGLSQLQVHRPFLLCQDFLQARSALGSQTLATVLPDFIEVENKSAFLKIVLPAREGYAGAYWLAWNPRLLRLNPHAVRHRDFLADTLSKTLHGKKVV